MERALLNDLMEWKINPNRKPLILKGVRQCGKTYLLKLFGERCYDEYVYFNFEKTESLKSIFDKDYDTERILFELGLYAGKTIQPGKTLVILDEIQDCERAITALKYFCENAKDYHIACAGSLIGVALTKGASFPVGKVDFLTMHPMSFTEFVNAVDSEQLAEYIKSFKNGDILPQVIADKLTTYMRQYYLTGGMPEVVDAWRRTKNIDEIDKIQQAIIDGYEFDFAKHAPAKDFPKLMAIWRSIPEQLAKQNTKFIFSHVKAGWRARELEDALEWLLAAGLVHKVCRIAKPYFPLSSYSDDTAFKLYAADVGILRKLSKLPNEVLLDTTSTYKEFKGSLTENYVLNELLCSACDEAYYWTSGNSAEVDFVISCGKDIVPIEVKSEKNSRSRSLSEYRKKYEPAYSVKTSMKNVAGGEEVLSIPLYIISSLKNFLK